MKLLREHQPNLASWEMINNRLLDRSKPIIFEKLRSRNLFTDGFLLSVTDFDSMKSLRKFLVAHGLDIYSSVLTKSPDRAFF